MAESQEDLEEHAHQSVIRGHHFHRYIWSPYIVLAIALYDAQLLLFGIAIPLSRSCCCTIQGLLYHPPHHCWN